MPRVLPGDVRQKILQAAQERLWHYGYKKTTIDEIAGDAGVGKGTVYLYFDSKEDIALTIIASFKEETLRAQETIVRDPQRTPVEKLRDTLTYPVVHTSELIARSPSAAEMILAVRPHIKARMRPYIEHEVALLAEILEEGNRTGAFDVEDTMMAARSLKYMTSGFWPPYPCVDDPEQRLIEIGKIIDLVVRGLRKCG